MAKNTETKFLRILVVLVFLNLFFVPSVPLNVETRALLEFKSNIIDPQNHLSSWNDSESPCHFNGITCDQNTGSVSEISLDSKTLSGVISPSIFTLKSIVSVVLPSNSLSGNLPIEVINCTSLKILNVTGNLLSGTVPDLSKLNGLQVLDLSNNSFTGKFPVWVRTLTGLVSLGIGDNKYDEGEIPPSLGNLKNLTWLYLASSNLTGEIPDSIFELEALQTLDICQNKISGKFPKLIGKLRNLQQIELYQNKLTGELPRELAELTFLQQFDISDNQMYGPLPEGLGKLKFLSVFHVFRNNFSGAIPPGFGDMENLFAFSVYMNSFSGEIPENLGRFSPLNVIDISENRFSGPFPKYLCQNRKLQKLLAVENSFSGEFPENYASCETLVRLRVTGNQLSGKIPEGVWALPNLNMMDFSYNNFTGGVSPRIGGASSLDNLVLSNNAFSGELPKEIGKLILLEKLYLDNNGFSGPLPSELGSLTQILSLHLEKNSFTGSIPEELGQCPRLADINLALNQLSGRIPDSLSTMNSLNSLNLSSNRLTGSVSRNLDNLRFSLVDLSNNQLTGDVSNDILIKGGDRAFLGNEKICVDQKTKSQFNTSLSVCDRNRNHRSLMKKRLIVLFIILFSLAVLSGGALFLMCWNFRNAHLEHSEERNALSKLESFHQIQFDADEICNLDDANLIGSGGTGKVYRVDLKSDCVSVAVKKLWKGNEAKILSREMEILGTIRHKNIVKLYASLMKGGSNYLVFEYMSNGNLYQALHRRIKLCKPEVLDWDQRYKIAVGAAKGIAYLHHDCSPPIIHRDIKSTNILLDENYEAKVSDFGIARISESSPGGSEFSCFAGTYGYMAPEMAYTLKLTEKSDVYSFGVMLLELVTGRNPLEDSYGDGKDIVYWVSTQLDNRENVVKVLDINVVCEDVVEDMIKVLRIATLCTTKLPNLRPTMKEVVKMLVDAQPSTPKTNHRNFDKNGNFLY